MLTCLVSLSNIIGFEIYFLQSILRQAKFKGAKLLGASFFDADLTGFYDTPPFFDCGLLEIW